GQAVLGAELVHAPVEQHQRGAEPVLLIRAQGALVEAAHGLPLHELAQQFHDGEHQGGQVVGDTIGVQVDRVAAAAGRRHSGPLSAQGAGIRSLTDASRACSEIRTSGTSAIASTRSPLTTTPVARTRSSRSTSGTPAGAYGAGRSQGTGAGPGVRGSAAVTRAPPGPPGGRCRGPGRGGPVRCRPVPPPSGRRSTGSTARTRRPPRPGTGRPR